MLCLWELHIALKCTCLWWVRSVVFFVSVLRNIQVYALVIFITLSVLMIFSNLTFLDTKQSGVQLVLKIQRVLGVQIRKSFVTIRDWREKYSKKPRSFSNEVSSNNAKSPFPRQLAEGFWLGNIFIYLFIYLTLPMNKQHITFTNIDNWQGTRYSLRQLQRPSI